MRFEGNREEELIRHAIAEEILAAEGRLEGLEERVIRALAERIPSKAPWWKRLREFFLPERPYLGLTYALAAILIGIGIGIAVERLFLAPSTSLVSLAQEGTVFALAAPGAKEVQLVGDFSAWKPIPLVDPEGDGVWTVVLRLPPGRYEYAFLVDGKWVGQDPAAHEYVRTLGDYTSVRYIGGEGEERS